MHGPTVGGRKAILCAFIDDHSRLLTGYRWARREDTVRLEAALHGGLGPAGIPDSIYVDNGSAFVDKQLLRACASLGIRLVHSRPGEPAGRGKIERFFRTVREQFLVEIGTGRELDDLDAAEHAVHRLGGDRLPPPRPIPRPSRPHGTGGRRRHQPTLPTPALLREAFCGRSGGP